MYPTILHIQKLETYSQVRSLFGFQPSDNIGKSSFPAVQAAPSFSQAFPVPLRGERNMPCLIPCAIDQVIVFSFIEVTCMSINLISMMNQNMRWEAELGRRLGSFPSASA